VHILFNNLETVAQNHYNCSCFCHGNHLGMVIMQQCR